MNYKMSPNIAVRTKDAAAAVEFYSGFLGFAERPTEGDYTDLDADPINLFILEDGEVAGPVMELFVDDLEKAREELVARGCEVIRWRGKGQDCYIRDPFGVMFNVWEISRQE